MDVKNNSLAPIITSKEFQDAYRSLSKASFLEYNPLRGFILVKQYALMHYQSESPASLTYAAVYILENLVIDHLVNLRQKFDLPAPDFNASLSQVIDDIQQDVRTDNTHLIGLSYIYHRYIRSDLEFTVEKLETHYALIKRSLRRYANRELEELRLTLIEAEMHQRRQHWQALSKQKLPKFHGVQLVGQTRYIQHLVDQFIHQNVYHIYLFGPKQCGKSTLAQQTASALIDQAFIHQIVYIDFRQITVEISPEAFIDLVEAQLPIPNGDSIQDYLALLAQHNEQLILVLDHISDWHRILPQADQWLSHCLVLATSTFPLANWRGISMECEKLDRTDSIRLMSFYDRRYPKKLTESVYFKLFEELGGHPQKLKLAILHYDPDKSIPVSQLVQTTHREYTLQQWHNLSKNGQRLWILTAILQNETDSISVAQLTETWTKALGFAEIEISEYLPYLVNTGLIIQDMAHSVSTYFIEDDILAIIQTSLVYTDMLNEFMTVDLGQYQLALLERLAEQVVDYEKLRPQLFEVKETILVSGAWQRWQNLLTLLRQQQLPSHFELEMDLEKAIAWRWSGQFEKALTQLQRIISLSKNQQLPEITIETLVEESNVQYWLGHTEVAHQSALEAYDLMVQSGQSFLQDRCLIALAQSLSQSNPVQARQFLNQVSQLDAQVWDVLARIELAVDNGQAALKAAQQSVEATIDTPEHPAHARAIGLYARLLDYDGQYHQAVREFNYAISLLQVNRDWLGLARLYTNYSLACIHYASEVLDKDRPEFILLAEQAIQTALRLHQNLQDPVSHKIAQDSLIYINQVKDILARR